MRRGRYSHPATATVVALRDRYAVIHISSPNMALKFSLGCRENFVFIYISPVIVTQACTQYSDGSAHFGKPLEMLLRGLANGASLYSRSLCLVRSA
jgi:hypothetical protein